MTSDDLNGDQDTWPEGARWMPWLRFDKAEATLHGAAPPWIRWISADRGLAYLWAHSMRDRRIVDARVVRGGLMRTFPAAIHELTAAFQLRNSRPHWDVFFDDLALPPSGARSHALLIVEPDGVLSEAPGSELDNMIHILEGVSEHYARRGAFHDSGIAFHTVLCVDPSATNDDLPRWRAHAAGIRQLDLGPH
jgi:hypothetical protein